MEGHAWFHQILCAIVSHLSTSKAGAYSVSGLLQPLPMSDLPWKMVTMDYVEDLPTFGRFNCLMVIIDKLYKYNLFISLHHLFTAETVA